MNKIIFAIIGIFVSGSICAGANAPRIDTIYLDIQDLSARTKPVLDLNDNPTALIKVCIPRYPDATIRCRRCWQTLNRLEWNNEQIKRGNPLKWKYYQTLTAWE